MFLSTFRRETGRCSSCVFAMQLTTFAILIFDKWIGHANNACAIRTSAHTQMLGLLHLLALSGSADFTSRICLLFIRRVR